MDMVAVVTEGAVGVAVWGPIPIITTTAFMIVAVRKHQPSLNPVPVRLSLYGASRARRNNWRNWRNTKRNFPRNSPA
jgi:hypothetical protein